MKIIEFSPDLLKKLEEIRSTDLKLFNRVQKQLELFQNDPRHPSLRLHKITREIKDVWSISINKSVRMLYTELAEELYFFEIGTHDEVYRKK